MKYRILSHTADLRLQVFGETIEELFKNAAEALADILHPRSKTTNASESTKERIKIKAANLNILLVDFLNEVLAKSQINKAVYRVKSIKATSDPEELRNGASKRQEAQVEAELEGIRVQEFKEDIKAVTYHEAQINQQPATSNKQQRWSARLVLDI